MNSFFLNTGLTLSCMRQYGDIKFWEYRPSLRHTHSASIGCGCTGLGVAWEGVSLGRAAPSMLSACLLMSRVVKRLDSIPSMWIMDSLLEGLGCKDRSRRMG